MAQDNGHLYSFLIFYSINLMYAILACLTVFISGPLVAASGVPEVKGWLNGVRCPGTLNLPTYIGKVVSIILAYSSILALGPEGPMVHIGAMVGAGIGSAKSKLLRIRLPWIFEKFRNHADQRDFIAAGTAAGITAAFGAPVGGVLFALEETSTFWSRELTWRTFWACMIAAFTVNIFNNIKDESSVLDDYGLLTFGISKTGLYRIPELIPMGFLGVIGNLSRPPSLLSALTLFIFLAGILGWIFSLANGRLALWRREYVTSKLRKLLEVVIILTITVCFFFAIPSLTPCVSTSNITYDADVCDNINANETARVLDDIYCGVRHSLSFQDLTDYSFIDIKSLVVTTKWQT